MEKGEGWGGHAAHLSTVCAGVLLLVSLVLCCCFRVPQGVASDPPCLGLRMLQVMPAKPWTHWPGVFGSA
jgi:hypothetical protein